MDATVSVVIPTHERAGLVGRAIASAFSQTARPAQVIVADDARDTATEHVVRALMPNYAGALVYVPLDPAEGSGASASRNAGARVASQRLLAFLDDDDWWDERYLETALATQSRCQVDVVITPSWIVVDGVQEEWGQPSTRAFAGFRPGVSGSNILLTREAFDSVRGFDTSMWVMNDVDFFVRLRENGVSVAAGPERLVFHEGRGDGHLTSPSHRRAQGLEHFLSVHGARMDRGATRLLKRRIHAARITQESTRLQRLAHRIGVAWFSTPADLRGRLSDDCGSAIVPTEEEGPVDVVVLWVDVTDEDWRRRRSAARGEAPSGYVGATNEWDTLRYLLRGIDRHCPWVRRIHLVTPGQVPDWLNTDAEDIVVVDQESILPAGHGPTFNSMAIEVNLDRIPDLAERFVYFNDDMLVVQRTRREDVFPHGRPAGFAIQNASSGSNAWSHWVLNAVGIIDRVFDKRTVMRRRPWQWFSLRYGPRLLRNIALLPWDSFTGFFEPHLPMALERQTFAEVRAAAPEEITRTSAATFRSLDCVIPFVYRYWQLCTGRFSPVSPKKYGRFFEIQTESIAEIERELARPRGHFLCLNDNSGADDAQLRQRVERALESALPGASRFERTAAHEM